MSVDRADLEWAQAAAHVDSAELYPRRLARELADAIGQLAVLPTVAATPGSTGTVQLAIPGNPSRIYLAFAATTTNPIYVGITGDPTGLSHAITLPTTGVLAFDFKKSGPLCTLPWYMYSADVAAVMSIYQVLIQP